MTDNFQIADQTGLSAALERMAKERDDLLKRVALIDQDLAELKRLNEKYPEIGLSQQFGDKP